MLESPSSDVDALLIGPGGAGVEPGLLLAWKWLPGLCMGVCVCFKIKVVARLSLKLELEMAPFGFFGWLIWQRARARSGGFPPDCRQNGVDEVQQGGQVGHDHSSDVLLIELEEAAIY